MWRSIISATWRTAGATTWKILFASVTTAIGSDTPAWAIGIQPVVGGRTCSTRECSDYGIIDTNIISLEGVTTMEKVLELELRQSEARQELSDLLESDPDSDKIGALTVEMRSLDRQIVAHKLAKPEPETRVVEGSPEGRELRQLVSRASLGKMMAGIADDGQGDGAERELRQARNLPDNYVPWDMLEKRAAVAVTGDEEGNTTPWIQRVFPNGAASFCGVDVQMAEVGEILVPVITTGVTIGFVAPAAAQAESSPVAAVTTLTPRRGTGNFPINREDLAKFPMMEDAFRQELTDAVQNAMDVDLLTLASKGLLVDGGTDPTDPSVATTAAEFLFDVYGAVDGAMSSAVNQNRLLVGPETYGYMGGLVYDAGSGMTVADKLASIGVQVFATDNAGAYANDHQDGLVIKGPPRRNAIGVTWRGIEIIRDEFSLAANGQLRFTVLVMWDFENIRSAGFVRKSYRKS